MADCVVCQRPIADTAYACSACSGVTADRLERAAQLWPELDAVITGQVRYSEPGPRARGHAPPQPHRPGLGDPAADHQPGWPGGLPVRLAAAQVRDDVRNTITTWARLIQDERGQQPPIETPALLRWLVGQLEWLRHQRYAEEALDELSHAARLVERAVDRPVPRVDAGLCLAATEAGPCQQRLSAAPGAAIVHCPACRTTHTAQERREAILAAARDIRGTAEECSAWLAMLGVSVRANTVRQWRTRGRLLADGVGRYRLGDVEALAETRLARSGA